MTQEAGSPERAIVQSLLRSRNISRNYSCTRLATLLTLCFAATMAGASTAVAYEAQVHFGITMWVAELRGFSEAEAYEIAKHDQAVDDDPETEPFWDWDSAGIRSRSEYH